MTRHVGVLPMLGVMALFLHISNPVILLPAHPASLAHNFVSVIQSSYFSESQDAKVLQTCH